VSDPLSFVSPGDPIGELARADRINLLIESARRVLRPQTSPSDIEKEIFRALQPHNIVYVKTPVPAREYTVWRIVGNLTSPSALLAPQAYRVEVPEDSCDPFVVLIEPSDGVTLARAAVSGVVFGYVLGQGKYAHAIPGDPYFLEADDYGPARILYRAGNYALLRLGDSRHQRRCKKLKTDDYGYAYYGPYGLEIEDEEERDEDEERQCIDCLAKLCVVRDYSGAIVDIFYENASGNRVRVPDCTSAPYGGGGGSGGGGGGGECCPQDQNSQYFVDYDITFSGVTRSGTYGPVTFSGINLNVGIVIFDPACMPPPFLIVVDFWCMRGQNIPETNIDLSCGNNNCTLQYPYDLDILTVGCPGLPTYYITIKPGRCASGSFVLRPA